jgi:Rod binding domain-containing protein
MLIPPLSTLGSTPSGRDFDAPLGASPRPDAEATARAARQFEAILVRQLLNPAIEPLMNGSATGGASTGGAGGGVFGYFLTDTLSNSIAEGGGLGLASVLTRQLSPSDSKDTE